MEFLTNCGLKEHVGLIHDDEMKKENKYAVFVEVNSTKNADQGSTWSSMMNHLQKKGKFKTWPVCNKMFITRRNLANPQIMHSESNPHDSDICEETVWRKDCIKTQYI